MRGPVYWVPGGGACVFFCNLKCMIFQVVAMHLVGDLYYFGGKESKIQH